MEFIISLFCQINIILERPTRREFLSSINKATGQCTAAKMAPDIIATAHLEGRNTIGGTRGGIADIVEHVISKISVSLHSGDRLLIAALATRTKLGQGRVISGDIRGYNTV